MTATQIQQESHYSAATIARISADGHKPAVLTGAESFAAASKRFPDKISPSSPIAIDEDSSLNYKYCALSLQ